MGCLRTEQTKVNSNSIKILLAVWGKYKDWKDAIYRYQDKQLTSKTPLPLLYEVIQPDYTYIVIGDTLLDALEGENISNISNYQNGLQNLREDTKDFIIKKISADLWKDERFDIWILPGVGTFTKLKFIGNPTNFYALVYFELAKNLLKILKSNSPKGNDSNATSKLCLEFFLDITHGFNYMTMMAYRAIKDILQILAYFCSVRLIVLNSDPFPIGRLQTNESICLNMNEIENINIIPTFNFYRYKENGNDLKNNPCKLLVPSSRSELSEKEKRELENFLDQEKNLKTLSDKMKNLYAFCGAFLHGVPIYMYYFYEKTSVEEIKKIISIYYNYLTIEKSGEFFQKVDFGKSFTSLLQAFILVNLFEIFTSMVQKKDAVSIRDINKVLSVFSHSNVVYQRLIREIERIERLKNRIDTRFRDYSEYKPQESFGPYDHRADESFNNRNFFAHCGFDANLTQLAKRGDDIFVKPKLKYIEEIRNALINSIPLGE